ncbi:hypothetical protein Hypma_006205 [Hypsizygus marmoreus]|uniref:Uncharacterized protein n=1 Tax=Hypsizygus marmoreus TaxID=39966 RepID=A0A369JY56_HYPMA|nr:hypothetical protein Hypma_006205 [Hypsizygus marmoreus]
MSFKTETSSHMLSKRSRDLDRDTFMFHPLSGRLWCGLNLKLTSITSAIFQRWIFLMDPDLPAFYLRPITLHKHGILRYFTTPSGPAISPHSSEPLPPGDYAWVTPEYPNFTGKSPFRVIAFNLSYAALKKLCDETQFPAGSADLYLYDIPPALEALALSRDKHCFITGSSSETTGLAVFWIVPPLWNFDTARTCEPEGDHTSHTVATNVGLMRKELIPAFHNNDFGIDVDDNYRIVIFRDFGPAMASLLPLGSVAHYRQAGGLSPGPADVFLREHFRKCLTVHLPRGDISDDYGVREIQAAFHEFGLSDRDEEVLPFSDERWHTVLGKELLEWYIMSSADVENVDSNGVPRGHHGWV